jgi:hypothetical protein
MLPRWTFSLGSSVASIIRQKSNSATVRSEFPNPIFKLMSLNMPQTKINRRSILAGTLAVGAAWSFPQSRTYAAMANDEVRMGFISCGGRAGEHLQVFGKMDGVKVAALCDPDSRRVASKKKDHPDAKTFEDLRKLLDDKDIDAVLVATSNAFIQRQQRWPASSRKFC